MVAAPSTQVAGWGWTRLYQSTQVVGVGVVQVEVVASLTQVVVASVDGLQSVWAMGKYQITANQTEWGIRG